jgi:hypothetical protein
MAASASSVAKPAAQPAPIISASAASAVALQARAAHARALNLVTTATNGQATGGGELIAGLLDGVRAANRQARRGP